MPDIERVARELARQQAEFLRHYDTSDREWRWQGDGAIARIREAMTIEFGRQVLPGLLAQDREEG